MEFYDIKILKIYNFQVLLRTSFIATQFPVGILDSYLPL